MADFDTNDGEQFITGRLDFETGTPLTGDTGDGEQFVTGRIDLQEFAEVEADIVIYRRRIEGY